MTKMEQQTCSLFGGTGVVCSCTVHPSVFHWRVLSVERLSFLFPEGKNLVGAWSSKDVFPPFDGLLLKKSGSCQRVSWRPSYLLFLMCHESQYHQRSLKSSLSPHLSMATQKWISSFSGSLIVCSEDFVLGTIKQLMFYHLLYLGSL